MTWADRSSLSSATSPWATGAAATSPRGITRWLISVDGLCALFEALVADGYDVIGPSGVLGRVPSEPTPAATVRRARSAVEGADRMDRQMDTGDLAGGDE